MPALPNVWYRTALHALGLGMIDLSTADVKIAVCGALYTPDRADDGHEFLSDVTDIQATSDLVNESWVNAVLDADDAPVVDPDNGEQGRVLVVYIDTGTASTSRLLVCFESADVAGLPITWDGTNDNLNLDPGGILDLG